MRKLSSGKSLTVGIAILAAASLFNGAPAHANDFFSSLFGALTGHAPPARSTEPLSYAPFDGVASQSSEAPSAPHQASSGGLQAFCVRTCDGRYFPAQAGNGESRAASCNSFCPASETKVFYGSSIDHATAEGGKSYSQLPNAFKYRSEIVPGCTCNGKSQFGLAKVDIKDDRTIRKGDLVASSDGLTVATRSADRRGASLNLSPMSRSARAHYEHLPIVASE